MKILIKSALICSLALLCRPLLAANEVNPCTKDQSKRVVSGHEPEARNLYKAACLANAGPWPDGFTEENFSYLGKLRDQVDHRYEIAFLSTTWGQSGRATNRLLVFSEDGTYLGRFSDQFVQPTLKTPHSLKFLNSAKFGNEVSFKNGIPSSMWVDGDNHSFERANQSFEADGAAAAQLQR